MRINGDKLTDNQRRQVLAAFVHRHTVENAKQTYGGACVMCSQVRFPYVTGQALADGPKVYSREQWHAYHVPATTDAAWLADHSFHFVKDGSRLNARHRFAEIRIEA